MDFFSTFPNILTLDQKNTRIVCFRRLDDEESRASLLIPCDKQILENKLYLMLSLLEMYKRGVSL